MLVVDPTLPVRILFTHPPTAMRKTDAHPMFRRKDNALLALRTRYVLISDLYAVLGDPIEDDRLPHLVHSRNLSQTVLLVERVEVALGDIERSPTARRARFNPVGVQSLSDSFRIDAVLLGDLNR